LAVNDKRVFGINSVSVGIVKPNPQIHLAAALVPHFFMSFESRAQPLGRIPASVLQSKSEYDIPGRRTEFDFQAGFPIQGFVTDVHLPYLDGICVLPAHSQKRRNEKQKHKAKNRHPVKCTSVTHGSIDTTL
jgi:hypothetical protein